LRLKSKNFAREFIYNAIAIFEIRSLKLKKSSKNAFFREKGRREFSRVDREFARKILAILRLRFRAKKRDFAGKRADSRETAVPYHRSILSVYLG
jgi:hypothetical protein